MGCTQDDSASQTPDAWMRRPAMTMGYTHGGSARSARESGYNHGLRQEPASGDAQPTRQRDAACLDDTEAAKATAHAAHTAATRTRASCPRPPGKRCSFGPTGGAGAGGSYTRTEAAHEPALARAPKGQPEHTRDSCGTPTDFWWIDAHGIAHVHHDDTDSRTEGRKRMREEHEAKEAAEAAASVAPRQSASVEPSPTEAPDEPTSIASSAAATTAKTTGMHTRPMHIA